MNAVTVLSEGTIRAAGLQLVHLGIDYKSVDLDALTETLKTTVKANLDQVLAEWKDATDAHMSEAWLRELMNAQCNTLALEALKSMDLLN